MGHGNMTISNLNLTFWKSSNVHANTLHALFPAILPYNNKKDIYIFGNTDKTNNTSFHEMPYNLGWPNHTLKV